MSQTNNMKPKPKKPDNQDKTSKPSSAQSVKPTPHIPDFNQTVSETDIAAFRQVARFWNFRAFTSDQTQEALSMAERFLTTEQDRNWSTSQERIWA
jgi:hypothetical protein